MRGSPRSTASCCRVAQLGAAYAHLARTVVRRAERLVVALAREETVNPAVIRFLNRLSDHLFVLGRVLNAGGTGDVKWGAGRQPLARRFGEIDNAEIGLFRLPALGEAFLRVRIRHAAHDDRGLARLPVNRRGDLVLVAELEAVDHAEDFREVAPGGRAGRSASSAPSSPGRSRRPSAP